MPVKTNHPKVGSTIKVEPIRSTEDVQLIKRRLADSPRNLCLFTLGINTNLRASDIVQLTVGQVRHLQPGDHLSLKEKKTSKARQVTTNKSVHTAVQNLLESLPEDTRDDELLFQSRKKGSMISVPHLNRMVKSWCKDIGLKGNYGSHTLRKTFGYIHRTVFKTDIPTLMVMFNHSSQKQTLEYLCIQPEEIQDAYMNEI